ncbi:MAG TPA: hypothetical protein VFL12_04540 [Thermoanaerobaculia bacterium]|nr:hypothetical protein [Thermoanaerobaculia bacterium]
MGECRIMDHRRDGILGPVCELCHSLLPKGAKAICPGDESSQCATRRAFHRANIRHLRLLDTATSEVILECHESACRFEGLFKNPDIPELDIECSVLCPTHELLGERVTLRVARPTPAAVNG